MESSQDSKLRAVTPAEPGGAPSVGDPESELSIMDVLLVLARGWRALAGITVLFGLVALVYACLQPFRYTAMTTLLPPQQSSSSSALLAQLSSGSALASGLGLNGGRTNADLYIGLLQSNAVVDAMIRRFDLQKRYHATRLSDARKALAGQTVLDGSEKDGLIRILVTDGSPERAAMLANGYVDAYRGLSANLAIGEAGQRRRFLEQQLDQVKTNLRTAEEAMKRTEQQGGVIQLDSQARALIESASRLRAQIAAKQIEVASLRSHLGPENPQLIQAQQELGGLQAQLGRLAGSDGENDNGILGSKARLPQEGLDYARAVREVKYNETFFDLLAKDYELAKLDEAREGALVQVVDPATPPDRKSGPSRLLITLKGTALGFVFAVFALYFRASRRFLRRTREYQVITAAMRRSGGRSGVARA